MAERGVPISEAAEVLGVSVDALRKRVQRRSVKAYKDSGGQWRVVLPDLDTPAMIETTDSLARTKDETPRAVVDAARQAEQEAIIQRIVAPFIAELGTVREELGKVKEQRDQLQLEVDRLRAQKAPGSPDQLQDNELAHRPTQTPHRVPEPSPQRSWRWPWERR